MNTSPEEPFVVHAARRYRAAADTGQSANATILLCALRAANLYIEQVAQDELPIERRAHLRWVPVFSTRWRLQRYYTRRSGGAPEVPYRAISGDEVLKRCPADTGIVLDLGSAHGIALPHHETSRCHAATPAPAVADIERRLREIQARLTDLARLPYDLARLTGDIQDATGMDVTEEFGAFVVRIGGDGEDLIHRFGFCVAEVSTMIGRTCA